MKILIVENDLFFKRMYSLKFTKEGFEVIEASDGDEALAKAAEVKPAIILLDLIMPKKDGFQVLKIISENPELKKIPVIVFSTLSQQEDIERAKSLGAADYMDKSKPDFEELLKKIAKLTSQQQ